VEAGNLNGGVLLMKLVFLLEEKSMKYLLDGILPGILPKNVSFITIPHEGKTDLEKSIPKKLKGWNEPDTKFVIVQDQDSNDCMALKQTLKELSEGTQRTVLIRIACHELESWYFGDIEALEKAYGRKLGSICHKSKYRVPDNIINPKQELKKIIPEHQQISGAKRVAAYMNIEKNSSKSFQVFIQGVQKIC
jgi:uncharacterized protein YktA (UPF0223 family)